MGRSSLRALVLIALLATNEAAARAAELMVDRTIFLTGFTPQTFDVFRSEWGSITHVDQLAVEFSLPYTATFDNLTPASNVFTISGNSLAYTLLGFGTSVQDVQRGLTVTAGTNSFSGIATGGFIGQGGLSSYDYNALTLGVISSQNLPGEDFGPYASLYYPDAAVPGNVTLGPLNTKVTFTFTYEPSGVPIPPQAVPEPSTWAMMMTGFGMLGMILRRRHGWHIRKLNPTLTRPKIWRQPAHRT